MQLLARDRQGAVLFARGFFRAATVRERCFSLSSSAMVIAIDIGGTKLAVAAVDAGARILARRKQPVEPARVPDQAAEAAAAVLRDAGLPWTDVEAAGACVPGIYCAASGQAWAPNLWGWDPFPLRGELQARIPVPVTLDSDRAAYVLGEQWAGAARGLSDVIFLAVGTGIGAGILSGGRLIRGAADIAGAVGWFALRPEKRDLYRHAGCFEAEAAGPAVARRAGMATAEDVAAAARRGDPRARAALEETARWLAMGVANLISALNPQMVVLGGGLMHAADVLLEPLRREVLDWAQPIAARDTRIEVTSLGDDAGLLGAARLAFTHVRPEILPTDH